MTPLLYCVHGWSYDATFWKPMLRYLPEYEAIASDQGYGGPPHFPRFPQQPFIAVGHSAGVLSLLKERPVFCRGLIAFNGFSHFCQTAPDDTIGIPPRVLTRMKQRLTHDPLYVIRSFRQMCGDTITPLPSSPSLDTLQQGLTDLLTCDHTPHLPTWSGRLDSICGCDDPLTPARLGLPFPARPHTLKGGHILPLTHPDLCAHHLRAIAATYDVSS